MSSESNKIKATLQDDDDDEGGENQIEILLRNRAVTAAAKLLLHNGVEDFWILDCLLEAEQDYFNYKLRRNVRREKLQTVLKLFGFKNTDAVDPSEREVDLMESPPETEPQKLESKLISFYKKWYYSWTIIVAMVECWYLIAIPFRCCFGFPRGIYSLIFESLICDMIMYVNILVRCFLPLDTAGVVRWHGTNETYFLKFWFWYDVLANIPFDYIGLAMSHDCTHFGRCDILAPYWQVNRILNTRGFIDTMLEVVESILQKLHLHPYAALVIVVTLAQTYLWHLFACFFFLDVWRRGDAFELITSVNVGNGTTVPLIEAPIELQYAASLDWSSKVMGGWDRGSDFALDAWTFVLNAAAVFLGLPMMVTFVAFVSGLVEMETPYIGQTMTVDTIIDVVKYKGIDSELRDEMIGDSWYRYDSQTHMLQAAEVLGDLPRELNERLLHFEGQRILGRVKLFAPLLQNEAFVISVARQLKPCIMAPHELLFEKGETGESMYFLIDGRLGVVNEDDWSDVRFTLEPGMFVGEIALLLGASRTATVVVLDNFVRMLSLEKKEFEVLRRKFPNTFAQVHQKARDRWLELNQTLLDKAKEIGKKEIEEIARRRFKLAQLKIAHGAKVVGSEKSFGQSINDDDHFITLEPDHLSQTGSNEFTQKDVVSPHHLGSLGDGSVLHRRSRTASNADVFSHVVLQAQIKDGETKIRSDVPSSRSVSPEHHADGAPPHLSATMQRENKNNNGTEPESTLQREAGKNLATAMFGKNKSSLQAIFSGSNNNNIKNTNDNDDDDENYYDKDEKLFYNNKNRKNSDDDHNGRMGGSSPTPSTDLQFFGRDKSEQRKNDPDKNFMKQFLMDTMRAQVVPENNLNDTLNNSDHLEQGQEVNETHNVNNNDIEHQQQQRGESQQSILQNNTSTQDREEVTSTTDESGNPEHHASQTFIIVDDDVIVMTLPPQHEEEHHEHQHQQQSSQQEQEENNNNDDASEGFPAKIRAVQHEEFN